MRCMLSKIFPCFVSKWLYRSAKGTLTVRFCGVKSRGLCPGMVPRFFRGNDMVMKTSLERTLLSQAPWMTLTTSAPLKRCWE